MAGEGGRHSGAFLMSKPNLNVETNRLTEATGVPGEFRLAATRKPCEIRRLTNRRRETCDRIRRSVPHSLASEIGLGCGGCDWGEKGTQRTQLFFLGLHQNLWVRRGGKWIF